MGQSCGTSLCNYDRLSVFVPLLPYIEQVPLYERIQAGNEATALGTVAPGGPSAWFPKVDGTASLLSLGPSHSDLSVSIGSTDSIIAGRSWHQFLCSEHGDQVISVNGFQRLRGPFGGAATYASPTSSTSNFTTMASITDGTLTRSCS